MPDPIEQLVGLGFSEYEAKAYLTLQRLRSATGYQVAKESGIPRSMIYQVLDRLIARGAVLTQSFGGLVRYAPDPPELLLERMRLDFEERIANLNLGLQSASTATEPGQVWNIEGRSNILARARELIENAQHSVAINVGDDDELDELLVWLRRARARGVALTIVSPSPYDAADLPISVYGQGQQLRQVVGHGFTLAVDGREALIGEVDRSGSAIWTTNAYAVAWIGWCLTQELAKGVSRAASSVSQGSKNDRNAIQ